MGATPYAGGVTFRVWAPFAAGVAVAGSFNRWSTQASPLARDVVDGTWSADVDGAAVGDQYKLVITTAGGRLLWKNDPFARSLTSANGNSVVADLDYPWRAADYSTPSWNQLVIYELHVGSFLFAADGTRGNFETVVTKLDYLRDLGINAIQLMPVDEFPGDISWGYNPAYIFAIEDRYGGPAGLNRLVDEAHARGIAVLFDVVYNHLGPESLDLWQFDGWSDDGQGGIYFYNDWRRQTPWGDTRPDYGRNEVQRYLRDNAVAWLEHHYIDGLRFDATGWIRNVHGANNSPGTDLADGWRLMQSINTEVRERQPWKICIAEDMQDNEWLCKSVADGGAGFSAQWGAGFMHTLRSLLIESDDSQRSMSAVRDILQQRYNGDAFQRVLYTESHDEVALAAGGLRLPEAICPGAADSFYAVKRSTLGTALVLTAPGIPMLFMGQELLEWGAWSDASPLDWSNADRFASVRLLYHDLIRLRRNWFGNTRGLTGQNINIHHVNDVDKVVAFHRWDQGGTRDDVIVIANFANRAYDVYRVGLPRGGRWRVRFNGDFRGYSSTFTDHRSDDLDASSDGADGMPFTGDVGLGPYTAIILSQD
jgi:1,4-alpha-glucan branching enzyme